MVPLAWVVTRDLEDAYYRVPTLPRLYKFLAKACCGKLFISGHQWGWGLVRTLLFQRSASVKGSSHLRGRSVDDPLALSHGLGLWFLEGPPPDSLKA